jgi:hypothetical protein
MRQEYQHRTILPGGLQLDKRPVFHWPGGEEGGIFLDIRFCGKYTFKNMAKINAATSFIPEVYENVVRQMMPFYDIFQTEAVAPVIWWNWH